MDYKIVYTNSAAADIDKLEGETAKRIIEKLGFFVKSKDPVLYAKKLKGFNMDTYRFRIGDYRVIFRLDKESRALIVLVVLRVLHRKSAYK